MNPYKILGIDPDANLDQIKKAYRKLSKEHHPDQGGNEQRFMEINLCYRILTDPNKRKIYDEQGIMVDESPEHLHNIVRGRLAGILEAWLENMVKGQKHSMEDFFDHHLNKSVQELNTGNGKIRETIRELKNIKKNITCESENNILASIIDQKIASLNKGLNQNKAEQDVLKALKEAVKEYGFEGETGIQERTIYFTSPTGGTSTFSWR